ncbi:hypothetical protein ACKWTF_014814 [Chironomus riparius]
MKSIFWILIIFVVFTCAIDIKKQPLREWYQQIYKDFNAKRATMINNHPLRKYMDGFSEYYTKKNMKFNENQNKIVNFAEAMILFCGSALKQFDDVKLKNAWNTMTDALVDFYGHYPLSNDINCFKLELKKIEPNSPILKKFNESSMAEYIETCESVVDMNGLETNIAYIEEAYGDLKTLTGGAIDRTEFKRILLTFVILSRENTYRKFNGTNRLALELIAALNMAFDAVLKDLNNRQ